MLAFAVASSKGDKVMRTLVSLAAALGAVFFAAFPAHAAVITYTLENVIFDDGGTVSGSFEYNTSTGAIITNDSIVTTPGSVLHGVNYDAGAPGGVFDLTVGSTIYFLDFLNSIEDQLGLSALISLSNVHERAIDFPAPGVAIVLGERYGTGQLVTDDLAVSEVPVPAALPLFLAGLAGFASVRRRRSRALNAA